MTAAGSTSYSYDNNGNVTARGSDSFSWEHENRLVSATIGGVTTTYAYNGDGLRMSRSSARRRPTSGTWPAGFRWSCKRPRARTRLRTSTARLACCTGWLGERHLPDADALGSITRLLGAAGNLTDTYTYDVFGAVRSHSGASGTEFTFTGEHVATAIEPVPSGPASAMPS